MSYVEEIDRLRAEVDRYQAATRSLVAAVKAQAQAERERDEARAEATNYRGRWETVRTALAEQEKDTEFFQTERDEARAALDRVRALGEGWVGFDDSHLYGDALLLAIDGPQS